MPSVPNLHDQNFMGEPKHVDQTKMLDTKARESVDMNEVNDNKEHIKDVKMPKGDPMKGNRS